jgi:hypothetical protein
LGTHWLAVQCFHHEVRDEFAEGGGQDEDQDDTGHARTLTAELASAQAKQ